MNTFSWLLIAHLVGDWLLQNDWMAKGKRQGLITLAGMAHFAIYTLVILGTLWLSGSGGDNPTFYISFGLLIFVSHWWIDATSVVECWINFFRQSKLTMMYVMVDQTFHLLILAFLAIMMPHLMVLAAS